MTVVQALVQFIGMTCVVICTVLELGLLSGVVLVIMDDTGIVETDEATLELAGSALVAVDIDETGTVETGGKG